MHELSEHQPFRPRELEASWLAMMMSARLGEGERATSRVSATVPVRKCHEIVPNSAACAAKVACGRQASVREGRKTFAGAGYRRSNISPKVVNEALHIHDSAP
jgi:hypothetical protein